MPIKGQSPKQIVHTEMHKYKYGKLHSGSKHGPLVKSRKQAIAIALSESGQSRRRRGGRYADGGDIQPYSINPMNQTASPEIIPIGGMGGSEKLGPVRFPSPNNRTFVGDSISETPTRYHEGGLPNVGEPAIPSGGQFSRGLPAVNKASDIASAIAGPMVIGGATLPYRFPKAMIDAAMTQPGSEEAHQAYGDVGKVTGEVGMSMLGPKGGVPEGSTFGVMVGPYGAKELLKSKPNEQRLTEGIADQLAQEALARGHRPYDVWKQFKGWHTGPEGKARKEIPDTGAKLVKNPDGDGYLLDHPAGDFHKLYDIPPIKFDPDMSPGEAAFNMMTNHIVVGGMPTKKNIKEATPAVLHEVQHAIQKKEGFSIGSNPNQIQRLSPEALEQETFGNKMTPWQVDKIKQRIKDELGVDPESKHGREILDININKPSTIKDARKMWAYRRSAGETEARNVSDRYSNPERYNEYPEYTEDIPRGIQHTMTNEEYIKRMTGKAVGGPVGNQKAPYRDKTVMPHTGDEAIELDPNMNDLRSEDRNRVPPSDLPDQDQPQMPKRFQFGGFNPEKAMSIGLARKAGGMGGGSGGLLKSQIPGRTDQIQASVPKGAYIIPADVVSGMGQGNTDAGGAILGKLMNRGPYNMNLPKRTAGSRVGTRHPSLKFSSKLHFADGGDINSTQNTGEPVLAAGGEYVVMPHEVAHLGAGDINTGHNILDAFVKHMREKTIQTMRKLPGPKGAKP